MGREVLATSRGRAASGSAPPARQAAPASAAGVTRPEPFGGGSAIVGRSGPVDARVRCVAMRTPTVDERLLEAPSSHAGVADGEGAQITALLIAAAMLRIGAAGGTVAVQLYVTDLAAGSPRGIVVGSVGSAQALSELLFALVLARFADRFGRTRFLIGGPLLGALALLLVGLCTLPYQIGMVRLIEGVGAAAFVPTALGTIAAATSHSRRTRAQASGAFEGATIVGYAGGFLMGGFAYHSLHRGVFVPLALCYLGAALICLRFVPQVAPLPVSPIGRVARAILGPGPVRSFIPAWLAVNALVGAWLQNLPSLLKRNANPDQTLVHHLDDRVIGGLLGCWAALLIVGIVAWTPFLQRHGGIATMRRSVIGTFLLVAVLFAMNHVPFGAAGLLLPLLVVAILVQAGFGPAAVAYLADCSEPLAADRSAMMAFYTVTLAGGGAVGALVGGAFATWMLLDGLLLLGLGLGLVAYVALARLQRYERRDALSRSADRPQ